MKIEIGQNFQHVTWIVKDFLELPQEDGFILDSPDFLFSGDRYCLRLNQRVTSTDGDDTIFHVRRLSVNFPEREVSCKVGYRRRERNGCEFYTYSPLSLKENYSYLRSMIEEGRDVNFPDGSLAVVCSMWMSEESTTGNSPPGGEEQEGFSGHCASFSSRWISSKMELITEAPCSHVEWSVPNFLELPRESADSLPSPEFRFAGDTYCFRFRPNGDTCDYDLQIVRRTSAFPERTVAYRFGYLWHNWRVYPNNSRSLVGKIGFCESRSKLEEKRDKYVMGGTFRMSLFLRLEEQSSAGDGTSDAAQKRREVKGIHKLQSDYRQALQKGTESDACVVVCGKEFPVHRAVLCARSTVFEAMFGHDTAEKESGRVVVDDLDPDSFGYFLEYLYTGDVRDKLSDDNAFGLYVAADKYDVSTLKSECVEHMHRTLSVDSFCDVLTLALRYREDELLQQSIQFFKDNLQSIIITAKWQQFVLDNGTAANELFIKAVVPGTQ